MKKVLILGGSGFIGRNLSLFLLKAGYEVYSFDLEKLANNIIPSIHYIAGDFLMMLFKKIPLAMSQL